MYTSTLFPSYPFFRIEIEDLFIRFPMIIHLIIPKQCLITISPGEILDSDVLIRELDFLVREGSMDAMIVMFRIQFICIQQGQDDCRTGNTTPVSTSVYGCVNTKESLFSRGLLLVFVHESEDDTGGGMGMIFDASSVEGEFSGVLYSAGLLDKGSSDRDNSTEQYSRSHFSYFNSSVWLAGLMDWR